MPAKPPYAYVGVPVPFGVTPVFGDAEPQRPLGAGLPHRPHVQVHVAGHRDLAGHVEIQSSQATLWLSSGGLRAAGDGAEFV